MKKIETYLNEDQYRKFLAKARHAGLSPYAFLKKIVLDAIETN